MASKFDVRKRLIVQVSQCDSMYRDGAPWTPEEDSLIGTAADRVVAAKINRSSVGVASQRMKLGIKARRCQ